MLTLRGVMGFLLAGAVIWLVFVLAGQIDGVSLALFELGLLGLSFFLWLRQRAESERRSTGLWWLLAAATAIGLIYFAARATPAARPSNTDSTGAAAAGAIVWTPFDRSEAERLAASGRLVFLDVTADWCVTCKVNERIVLNAPEVIAAFRAHDVLPMKADWTNRDDGIARFLAAHGRYGIPFYMLYRPGQAPHLFGELLNAAEVARVITESAARR
jgi:suppressor for copper-sensitivity B